MAKRRRGSTRAKAETGATSPLVPVESAPTTAATQQAGVLDQFNAWMEAAWSRICEFAQRVWEGITGVAEFAADLAKLTYAWLFQPEAAFAQQRLRFKTRYLAVRLDPNELAVALTAALGAR